MKDIDYERFYKEFTLDFLTKQIGDFTKQETETILNNISINGIHFGIDLFGVREAFLRSLPQDIRNKCKQVNGKNAYEFLFRAEVLDRIKKLQK